MMKEKIVTMKVFLFIICLVLSLLLMKVNDEIKILRNQNDNLSTKLDSLTTENFINYTNSERYRIASEYLMEEDKDCGIKFEKNLSKLE